METTIDICKCDTKSKPRIGDRVLIFKRNSIDDKIEADVAFYLINGNNKRKRGFFSKKCKIDAKYSDFYAIEYYKVVAWIDVEKLSKKIKW